MRKTALGLAIGVMVVMVGGHRSSAAVARADLGVAVTVVRSCSLSIAGADARPTVHLRCASGTVSPVVTEVPVAHLGDSQDKIVTIQF